MDYNPKDSYNIDYFTVDENDENIKRQLRAQKVLDGELQEKQKRVSVGQIENGMFVATITQSKSNPCDIRPMSFGVVNQQDITVFMNTASWKDYAQNLGFFRCYKRGYLYATNYCIGGKTIATNGGCALPILYKSDHCRGPFVFLAEESKKLFEIKQQEICAWLSAAYSKLYT